VFLFLYFLEVLSASLKKPKWISFMDHS
jgi:hypothetical protein